MIASTAIAYYPKKTYSSPTIILKLRRIIFETNNQITE